MLTARHIIGLLTLLWVLPANQIHAQFGQEPDSAKCATAIRQIGDGTVDPAKTAWKHVPWCGASTAGPSVGAAIRRSGENWAAESPRFDTYLAGLVRDDHVFDAALSLALKTDAPLQARLAALDILGRQADANHPSGLKEDGTCWRSWSAEYMGIPWPWAELGDDKKGAMREGLASICGRPDCAL